MTCGGRHGGQLLPRTHHGCLLSCLLLVVFLVLCCYCCRCWCCGRHWCARRCCVGAPPLRALPAPTAPARLSVTSLAWRKNSPDTAGPPPATRKSQPANTTGLAGLGSTCSHHQPRLVRLPGTLLWPAGQLRGPPACCHCCCTK